MSNKQLKHQLSSEGLKQKHVLSQITDIQLVRCDYSEHVSLNILGCLKEYFEKYQHLKSL
uniref:Uncharacterized protein n=1 Tax=Anguilla anguilla TaxID=7936 RepID=A0A0E9QY57_ANGAN